MRNLYHGTVYDILEIDIEQGKGYKDFGKGFYATSVKSHAENIARRNKRIKEAKEKRIRERNLPKQYFFGTQAAIQMLRFGKIRREIVG